MNTKINNDAERAREVWRAYMEDGEPPKFVGAPWYMSRRLRPLFLRIPSGPRCHICYYPFHSIGGMIMRHVFGIEPSRLNPNFCNACEQFAKKYPGGTEVEVNILFVDVRGSSKLAENMNPSEFGQLINRFYHAATKVMFESGAMVEKLIGDGVTGFYTPGVSGSQHAQVAIDAAQSILKATGHHSSSGPWVPVGIGIHTGRAFVGSVSSEAGTNDIAVLGETPNTGARLASLAGPGEIYISQATARSAGLESNGVEIRRMNLKGRSEPVDVWVLKAKEKEMEPSVV